MPINNLQRQFRELGRLRMGVQVPNKGKPGTHPSKLETWRLTSSQEDLLKPAAAVYGGEVRPWKDGSDGDAFELITTSAGLRILIPPGAPMSQWNELWTGGGCVRRCDGTTELLSGKPCLCPAEPAVRVELAAKGEACKTTTRLPVALPELPDVGIWLLVTHGYYAAVELMGTANLLAAAADAGRMIPAELAIEKRSVKRPGQGRKDFIVPVIRISASIAELSAGRGIGDMPPAYQLAGPVAPARPALPPGPALPAAPEFATTAPPRPPADREVSTPAREVIEPDVFGQPDDPGPQEAPAAAKAVDQPTSGNLAGILRDTAAGSALQGPMTDPQKARLADVLGPLGRELMAAGLRIAFGDVTNAEGRIVLSSAQANTVIAAAGDEHFLDRWRAMVDEAGVPA